MSEQSSFGNACTECNHVLLFGADSTHTTVLRLVIFVCIASSAWTWMTDGVYVEGNAVTFVYGVCILILILFSVWKITVYKGKGGTDLCRRHGIRHCVHA